MAECSICKGYTKYNGGLCSSCYAKSKVSNNSKAPTYKNKSQPTLEALKLGKLLEKYGYKVEYEKYDGYKHIDIALVKYKVNIEVDGKQHHGKTQRQHRGRSAQDCTRGQRQSLTVTGPKSRCYSGSFAFCRWFS